MPIIIARDCPPPTEFDVDYFLVDKIDCSECVSKIERSISAINGVQNVRVSLVKRIVSVRGSHSQLEVLYTLNHQGFAANVITAAQAQLIGVV